MDAKEMFLCCGADWQWTVWLGNLKLQIGFLSSTQFVLGKYFFFSVFALGL